MRLPGQAEGSVSPGWALKARAAAPLSEPGTPTAAAAGGGRLAPRWPLPADPALQVEKKAIPDGKVGAREGPKHLVFLPMTILIFLWRCQILNHFQKNGSLHLDGALNTG